MQFRTIANMNTNEVVYGQSVLEHFSKAIFPILRWYLPRGGRFFCTPKKSRLALGITQTPVQWYRPCLPEGKSGRGAKLTAHLHLMSRLVMSGAVPPLLLYAFMACFVLCRSTDLFGGDSGSTVVKVLCYNSEGRWFDPSWCRWIFH